MRVVSTRVLPLPAPARISADSSGRVTAARCSGLDAQADRTRSNPFKRTRCRTVFVEAHFIVQCQNDCLSPDETERLPDFLRLCISPPPMLPNPFVCIVRNKKAGSGSPIPTPLFVPNDADKWIWAHGRRRNTQSKEIRKTFRLIRTQTIILTLNNKMRFNKDCPASSPLKRV